MDSHLRDSPTAAVSTAPATLNLTGRVAIVTGATAGIGRATAFRLAGLGATVVVIARHGTAEVASELRALGYSAEGIACDVSDQAQVDAMVSRVVGGLARVDILVNNAAVAEAGRIEDISFEDWTRVLAVNLTSQFLCCKSVVPTMKARRYGRIVNVSSMAARFRSGSAGVHYVASKAGVLGLTRQLAYETAQYNIRVNAVCPGQTDTDMLRNVADAQDVERIAAAIPIGRIARTEEQADVIAFLASDLAGYMTGAIVDVNGGQW